MLGLSLWVLSHLSSLFPLGGYLRAATPSLLSHWILFGFAQWGALAGVLGAGGEGELRSLSLIHPEGLLQQGHVPLLKVTAPAKGIIHLTPLFGY